MVEQGVEWWEFSGHLTAHNLALFSTWDLFLDQDTILLIYGYPITEWVHIQTAYTTAN